MNDMPPIPPVDPEKIARQRHFALGLFRLSGAFLVMFGMRREQVIGRTSTEIGIWGDPRDRERFGTVIGAVDDLARSLRVVDDLTVGESAQVLRIDP